MRSTLRSKTMTTPEPSTSRRSRRAPSNEQRHRAAFGGSDKASGRAAQQDRLDPNQRAWSAPAMSSKRRSQRRAVCELRRTRAAGPLPERQNNPRSGRIRCADCGIACAAVEYDRRKVHERFDVVHERWLTEKGRRRPETAACCAVRAALAFGSS